MSDRTLKVIEAINRMSREPFSWDALSCCHFGDAVAQAAVGVSFMKGFHYSTIREAVTLINARGGLRELISSTLGVEPSGVSQLEDGDPVLAELESGATVGVKLGDRVVFKTETGVRHLPVLAEQILCGWSLKEAACLPR